MRKLINYKELQDKLDAERQLAIKKLKEQHFHNNYYLGYLDMVDIIEKFINKD